MSNKKEKSDAHRTETPDVSHIRNVEVTHEVSDINIGAVLTFVAFLTVGTIAVYIGMWLLFGYFSAQEAKEPKPGPMALSKEERLPPEPRLQAAPGFGLMRADGSTVKLELREPQAEYRELRKQWDQVLEYGPKDQSGNPVGLPIDEAIKKIVLEGKLPVRSKDGSVKLEDYAIATPTAASSGKETERRTQ
jgi:hypothetical protein